MELREQEQPLGRGNRTPARYSAGIKEAFYNIRLPALGMVIAAGLGLGTALITQGAQAAEDPALLEKTQDIRICDGGKEYELQSGAVTVAAALQEAGIELSGEDRVFPALADPIREGQTIEIRRAFEVRILQGEAVVRVVMTGGTAADALERVGIVPDEDDLVSESLDTPLAAGMEISFTDVEKSRAEIVQEMDYERIIQQEDSLEYGVTKVKQEGKKGEKRLTYSITSHNGQEVSRELIAQQVVRPPQNNIVLKGTDKRVSVKKVLSLKNDQREESRPPLQSQIKETVYVEVTAYTHTGDKTATGTTPKVGTIAVNPEQIPYGTRLYVEGYGYGVAEDTGAFRHTERFQIDLFMDTVRECMKWGRQRKVKVFLLKD